MSRDKYSLAHTIWNCKYHIVFAPKYRRQVFFGQKRLEIGKILRKLCEFKQVTIIEAEVCPDHVHMLVEIPPKMSVSGFVGYLIENKGEQAQETKIEPVTAKAEEKPQEPQRPAEGTWYCPECGAPNTGKFCVKCGTKKHEE